MYDRAVPPVEAVQLLADALARLSEVATVVVTPGNHDSAIRLGFAAPLMRTGVHLRARVADVGRPVLLADDARAGGGATRCRTSTRTRCAGRSPTPTAGADGPAARARTRR